MIKKILLPVIVFIAATIVEAEESFQIGTEKVISSEKLTVKGCGNYSLSIVKQQFPEKYEMMVPEKFRINGFNGPDYVISSKVMLENASRTQVSEVASNVSENGRTYLPMSVKCKANSFVVYFWSGGNCDICELFKEFKIINNEVDGGSRVSYSHVSSEYK